MTQLDLDDLPPRIAESLTALGEGEALVLVRGGVVVGRLVAERASGAAPAAPVAGLSAEEEVAEVLEHFGSIINDEF